MNNHLTSRQMLAYLDGELSRSETHHAEDHLHSCWTCRSKVERLTADIATILDAQNESFSTALQPPPRPWPSFNALLARNASPPPIPLWARTFAHVNSLLSPVRVLVSSAAIVVLVILAYSAFRSRAVSAKEVLRQVQIADTNRTAITKDQVIRERVHIRKTMRGENHSQAMQVDTWKSLTAAYWNAPDHDSVAADLEAQYRAHNIPIGLPLSAASADSWGKVAGGSPTVSQQGSDVDLSFAGTDDSATGAVERVNFLIQPETWQVKQMTLEFPDASFEVTEDDFSVVPVSAVPPELLAYLEPEATPQMLVQPVAHRLSGVAASLIHVPAVNLDHAELEVFATLHRLNADLGEPVTVTRSSHSVQVGLWQLPPDRQNELRAALEPVPGVQVELTAPVREHRDLKTGHRTAHSDDQWSVVYPCGVWWRRPTPSQAVRKCREGARVYRPDSCHQYGHPLASLCVAEPARAVSTGEGAGSCAGAARATRRARTRSRCGCGGQSRHLKSASGAAQHGFPRLGKRSSDSTGCIDWQSSALEALETARKRRSPAAFHADNQPNARRP